MINTDLSKFIDVKVDRLDQEHHTDRMGSLLMEKGASFGQTPENRFRSK
jgi:hypothetical protein